MFDYRVVPRLSNPSSSIVILRRCALFAYHVLDGFRHPLRLGGTIVQSCLSTKNRIDDRARGAQSAWMIVIDYRVWRLVPL